MSKALERLLAEGTVTELTPGDAEGFLAQDTPRLVFCPGDPARKPEVHDVAVVLREIVRMHRDLAVGVVPLAHDEAVRDRLGITKTPSVSFARAGRLEEVLGGIQDWSRYEAALARLLGPEEVRP